VLTFFLEGRFTSRIVESVSLKGVKTAASRMGRMLVAESETVNYDQFYDVIRWTTQPDTTTPKEVDLSCEPELPPEDPGSEVLDVPPEDPHPGDTLLGELLKPAPKLDEISAEDFMFS
jgi:hypothetical protein